MYDVSSFSGKDRRSIRAVSCSCLTNLTLREPSLLERSFTRTLSKTITCMFSPHDKREARAPFFFLSDVQIPHPTRCVFWTLHVVS